jgi:DNA-binding transcriptional ArsR family regulator
MADAQESASGIPALAQLLVTQAVYREEAPRPRRESFIELTAARFVYNICVMERSGYRRADGKRLDATFAALAHPIRRAILERLSSGEASVADLADPFSISQPAISRHLRVLEQAGLISTSADAQRRPRKLDPRPLAEAARWLVTHREFWKAPSNASTAC